VPVHGVVLALAVWGLVLAAGPGLCPALELETLIRLESLHPRSQAASTTPLAVGPLPIPASSSAGPIASPADGPGDLEERADRGDADAALSLSWMYLEGRAVPADRGKWLFWLQRAADLGHRDAAFRFGMLCAEGKEVPRDFSQAARYWQIAAERGELAAMIELGVFYQQGETAAQDFASAAFWFERARQAGAAGGAFLLGRAYDSGRARPRDSRRAMELYREAAVAGNSEALAALGEMFENGDVLPADPVEALSVFQLALEKKVDPFLEPYLRWRIRALELRVGKDEAERARQRRQEWEEALARRQLPGRRRP